MPLTLGPARRLAVAAVATAVVLSGCSDDGTATGDPDDAPSAPSSDSASTGGGTTEPTEPSEPTDPSESTTEPADGVEPATGAQLTESPLTFNLPEDWKKSDPLVDFSVTGVGPEEGLTDQVIGAVLPTAPDGGLETLEQSELRSFRPSQSEVLPREEIDGSEFVHIAGMSRAGRPQDTWSGVVGSSLVSLKFIWGLYSKPAGRQADMAAMIASVSFD